jgi:hypothetical protein
MSRGALNVAWYRFRATLGRRWGGYLSLVLLIGLVGGLAMGSAAAPRRTQSSFSTHLANVVAVIPARIATRPPTALMLRAE